MYKKRLISVLAALTMLVSSCGLDWMQIEPTDGLIAERYWTSKEDVLLAVMGCYQSIIGMGTSPSGTDPVELFFAWGELRADMVQMGDSEYEYIKNLTYGKMEVTNTFCDWSNVYKVINFCNEVLDRAPGVQALDPSFTDKDLHELEAEARGIRALMYFYLTRTYGAVPVRTAPSQTDNQEFNIPAYSEEFVLNFILDEMLWVKEHAVESFDDNAYDHGRITKNVARAILADLYLWRQEPDECVKEVDEIIRSGQYALFDIERDLVNDATDPAEMRYRVSGASQWFNDMYLTPNNKESVFELRISDEREHPFAYKTGRLSTQQGRAIVASDAVAVDNEFFGIETDESFGTQAQRDAMNDLRGLYCSFNPAMDNVIWKYIGTTIHDRARTVSKGGSFYVYRYADLLLLKAEALATKESPSQAELQEALDIVEDIRARRNAYCSTYREVRVSGQIDPGSLESYVLEERSRELAYEGKRFYDLFRYARRSEGNRKEVAGLLSAVASVDYAQEIAALYQNLGAYYWPYFQNEIEANPALVQNPYYNK